MDANSALHKDGTEGLGELLGVQHGKADGHPLFGTRVDTTAMLSESRKVDRGAGPSVADEPTAAKKAKNARRKERQSAELAQGPARAAEKQKAQHMRHQCTAQFNYAVQGLVAFPVDYYSSYMGRT